MPCILHLFYLFFFVVLLRPSAVASDQEKLPGSETSVTTKLLESGADLIQNDAPIEQIAVHLVGFHPMKEDPSHQMVAHHYCNQVNQDFMQCVLFDGNTAYARMNGVEYVISEKLFETLPLEEKKYWHPHNYEILSGQLVAPGIPAPLEHKLMDSKMNSYGKTWHFWMTGVYEQQGDELPFGEPHLAWSFNRDGEARPGLVEARDGKLEVDTAEARANRQDLVPKARPQCGVDSLAGAFARETSLIAGVQARRDGCPGEDAGGQGDPQ